MSVTPNTTGLRHTVMFVDGHVFLRHTCGCASCAAAVVRAGCWVGRAVAYVCVILGGLDGVRVIAGAMLVGTPMCGVWCIGSMFIFLSVSLLSVFICPALLCWDYLLHRRQLASNATA